MLLFRYQGSGFRVQGSGFRVQVSGFRGYSPKTPSSVTAATWQFIARRKRMRWLSRIRCPGAEAPDNKTELKLRTPGHRVRCGNAPNPGNQLFWTVPRFRCFSDLQPNSTLASYPPMAFQGKRGGYSRWCTAFRLLFVWVGSSAFIAVWNARLKQELQTNTTNASLKAVHQRNTQSR